MSWLSLRRDRVALALTFVLPMVFFSVFAVVFGGAGAGRSSPVELALVIEDRSELAIRFREILPGNRGLSVVTADEDGAAIDRREAIRLVRSGQVDVAAVISPRACCRPASCRSATSCCRRLVRPAPRASPHCRWGDR